MFSVCGNEKKINQNNPLLFSVELTVAGVSIDYCTSGAFALAQFIPPAGPGEEPLPSTIQPRAPVRN